ncbi:exported hypothetical protein [Bradyrhizobium sp. STM 3843]|uniref:hypothetical protein n=1 Tax=Bradyrhizobium sp. STM 3843 TaxID=551947 RepID=UPI00024032A9|nr:hypothetical protein [Bradyrhizobium sp. STM 3843]CCE11304.1 exported hypothetical protein [Bradyrhizobium sp. STM 3843]
MRLHHILLPVALMIGTGAAAYAQDSSKLPAQKWRPKDGIYAVPGPDHATRCGDQAEAYVELGENFIGGNEYGCSIRKITDLAPGRMKLEAQCDDAQTEKPKNELILLKRIDDYTFSWSQITRGASTAGVTFAYCPEDAQRTYRENSARAKEEKAKEPTQKQ